MNKKILFVDDDPNILSGFKRILGTDYEISVAVGGEEGLARLNEQGPFAVVVSDMRMPKMDGVTFLRKVKQLSPQSVRIILTGFADIDAAMDAVNQGNIFRFLTKPCGAEVLKMALDTGVEQYRLVTLEREILEKTVRGSVQMLTEMLGLANPEAFSRASRIRRFARRIAEKMGLPNVWQVEMAAMLSQVGCVTLPRDVLHKIYFNKGLSAEEQKLFDAHPATAAALMAQIPHLELVSRMIAGQHTRQPRKVTPATVMSADDKALLGAQILKACLDYDQLRVQGKLNKPAVLADHVTGLMLELDPQINPAILDAIGRIQHEQVRWETRYVKAVELGEFMIIDEDVKNKKNEVVVERGQEAGDIVRQLLATHARGNNLREPFRVIVMKP
jgi:response regulator RpfG family c-di-GMP phosphodiesterase